MSDKLTSAQRMLLEDMRFYVSKSGGFYQDIGNSSRTIGSLLTKGMVETVRVGSSYRNSTYRITQKGRDAIETDN